MTGKGIKTMYEVESALKTINGLEPEGRMHIQHVFRNGLQTIASIAETKGYSEVTKEVLALSEALRRIGI